MENMFSNCLSLKTLILRFDTSKVTNMKGMFSDCTSLIYLDIANLNTSSVVNMENMFSNSFSLKALNLSFKTSKVTNMKEMFNGCSSLISLNLNNFDTSEVTNMEKMFMGCSSLLSLDLSNFNLKKVKILSKIFYGCIKLQFLNISSFYRPDSYEQIFTQIPENIVYCINYSDNDIDNTYNSIIIKPLKTKKCSVFYCSSDWKEKKKKYVEEEKKCLEECINDPIYKYKYEDYCYDQCPEGTHELPTNQYECEKNQILCNENEKYPYFNLESNKCVKSCGLIEFFNNRCINGIDSLKVQQRNIHNIIKEIEKNVNTPYIENTIIQNKDEIIIRENNLTYQLTSTENENNKFFSVIYQS